MKRRKTNTLNQVNINNTTYKMIAWILFSLFAFLFLTSPYERGLFFDTDYFSISMAIQALFLISLVAMFPTVIQIVREQWKIVLLFFAIPVAYTVSFWYSYSPSMAAYEALQWFSYVLIFFLLLVWMVAEDRLKEWGWLLSWLTMLWITGLVFLVDFQFIEFNDAILNGRFSSVFQYPNTFAALLSVFVLVALMNLTKRLSSLYTFLYAFTLFPLFLAFLLTESRGALLVIAAAWVLAMFFLSWKEQLLYLGYSVVLILAGFWGYTKYGEWMQAELIGRSIAVVVGLAVVMGIFLVIVQYMFVQRRQLVIMSRWNFLAPTLMTVTGALGLLLAGSTLRDKLVQLFPEGLQRRVASISLDEAYSRILFFKDALVVWKDHFLLGTGGGGWRALFESYKSLPYYSTQAHSFYMQTVVEVGLLGSLVVFGFLFYVVGKGIWFYFRQQRENGVEEVNPQQGDLLLSSALLGALILLLHSAIDFNMSFGTYNFFLFLFLALIWNATQEESWLGKRLNSTLTRLQEKLTERRKNVIAYSFIGVFILSSLFATYTSYAYNQAELLQGQLQEGGSLPVLLAHVDRAIAYNSNDVRFRQMKLNVLGHAYQQTGEASWLEQMKEEYERILAKEPNMYQHYLQYSQFLWDIGEQEKAIETKLQALALAPWQQSIYEDIISSGLKLIEEMDENGRATGMLEKLNQVMKQYEDRLRAQVEEAPEGLTLTARIQRNYDHQLKMAQLYLYQEKYTAVLNALSITFPESWLKQEWYLNMFVEEKVGEEELVRPFHLQMLLDDLQRYLKEGHIIILAGEGPVANRISQPVKDLLTKIGSNITNLGVYDSYAGVIVDGKMVTELMDEKKPVRITDVTHPELKKIFKNQEFSIYSAGHELGNESAIIWQGKDHAIQGMGLSIVVLDKNLNVIEHTKYNTHYWDYKIILKDE